MFLYGLSIRMYNAKKSIQQLSVSTERCNILYLLILMVQEFKIRYKGHTKKEETAISSYH